jgi:hypothetical protein
MLTSGRFININAESASSDGIDDEASLPPQAHIPVPCLAFMAQYQFHCGSSFDLLPHPQTMPKTIVVCLFCPQLPLIPGIAACCAAASLRGVVVRHIARAIRVIVFGHAAVAIGSVVFSLTRWRYAAMLSAMPLW